MTYQPSSTIPGIFAILLLLLVFGAAVIVRVYDAASNYMQTPAKTNSNAAQVTPSRYPANPANPANNINLYSNANTMSSNANSNYGGNINTGTTSGNIMLNSNGVMMSNTKMSNSTISIYTWRVVEETALRREPSESGENIEVLYADDGLKMNGRRNDGSKWYNVTTQAGNTGWIDGNFIEEK